jgi:hypothetical protein
MPRVSPTIEGFRATFRRPSLLFAEIAWRWIVGAMALGLFFFGVIEYLNTLPVTNSDAALLATKQPFLAARAIAHILRGSLNRAVLAALFAVIALSLLWIVVASMGRAATVRALLDHFRGGEVGKAGSDAPDAAPRPLSSLIGLNFLRAALALSAVLAFAGAAVISSFASPPTNPQPGLVFLLFFPLVALISTAWAVLNWILSLAGIFAVRNGDDVLGAISAAISLVREHLGAVFAVSTWSGLGHLIAISVMSTALWVPLVFLGVAPVRLVIAAMILVTLVYFAVVDWLYMARLSGYICIAEMPALTTEATPVPASLLSGSIDRDEPILSDIPNLAVET